MGKKTTCLKLQVEVPGPGDDESAGQQSEHHPNHCQSRHHHKARAPQVQNQGN